MNPSSFKVLQGSNAPTPCIPSLLARHHASPLSFGPVQKSGKNKISFEGNYPSSENILLLFKI
jgi:hypothetical protein